MAAHYVVLGSTGHIGSAVAKSLLAKGHPVVAVTRDAEKAKPLKRLGAEIAQADVLDKMTLTQALGQGNRLFVLNPPAPPSTDTDIEERKSMVAITEAVRSANPERIVVLSAYGAQQGKKIFDLGVLYEFEQALKDSDFPVAFVRAAYFMSNWDAALETAKSEGKVHTFYPVDFQLPMVDPNDIGEYAAKVLSADSPETGIYYVEGPEPYSSADVAKAFSQALGHPVEAIETPRAGWEAALKEMGFSEPAAESMSNMTELTLRGPERPENPHRGKTSIDEYVQRLVAG